MPASSRSGPPSPEGSIRLNVRGRGSQVWALQAESTGSGQFRPLDLQLCLSSLSNPAASWPGGLVCRPTAAGSGGPDHTVGNRLSGWGLSEPERVS